MHISDCIEENQVLLDSAIMEALNRLAANSDDHIFVVNDALCIEYLNGSASSFMGLETGEVKGKSYADFLPGGSGELLASNFRAVLESGKPAAFENKIILPDKEVIFDVSLSPVRNGSVSAYGVLGIARDITRRKHQENLIAHSRRAWLRAVDAMPHCLAVVGCDHRIERVNQAMALRLKSTVRDAIGLTCYEQFHGRSEPPLFCPLLNGICAGDYTAEVNELHLGEASVSNISCIKDEEGKTVGCLYITREVTEQERAVSANGSREEYIRMFLRETEYAVSIQNIDGRYVYFNAWPGDRTPWGLIGNFPVEFFEPKTASEIVGRVREVAVKGTELTQEIDFAWRGEVLRFFDRISPVRDAMGRIKAVMTVSVKIGDFRHSEAPTKVPATASKDLSAREQEILRLIAHGFTAIQVAEQLGISRKTVETHRARIMEKLNLHKTSALVSYAAKMGLLE
jgi:PAS domain S-box-containing protein